MALIFEVKVIPSSGKKGWVLDKSGILKCYLKSPPEKGKANRELVKQVAESLGIAQDMVMITSGAKSRKKKIRVEIEMTYNQLLSALGVDWPMDMFS